MFVLSLCCFRNLVRVSGIWGFAEILLEVVVVLFVDLALGRLVLVCLCFGAVVFCFGMLFFVGLIGILLLVCFVYFGVFVVIGVVRGGGFGRVDSGVLVASITVFGGGRLREPLGFLGLLGVSGVVSGLCI